MTRVIISTKSRRDLINIRNMNTIIDCGLVIMYDKQRKTAEKFMFGECAEKDANAAVR